MVMATSALLSIFAVFVAIRACRPATKERYSAALLCGLVGHALAPILLVLVLTGSPLIVCSWISMGSPEGSSG